MSLTLQVTLQFAKHLHMCHKLLFSQPTWQVGEASFLIKKYKGLGKFRDFPQCLHNFYIVHWSWSQFLLFYIPFSLLGARLLFDWWREKLKWTGSKIWEQLDWGHSFHNHRGTTLRVGAGRSIQRAAFSSDLGCVLLNPTPARHSISPPAGPSKAFENVKNPV